MAGIPVVPVQSMVKMGWPRDLIAWAVRLRQVSYDASEGTLTLPNGNSALYSDSSGNIAEATSVSPTELGYLNGVTSGIQTQLNTLGTSKFNATATGGTDAWNDVLFNLSASRTIGAGVPVWTDINSTGRYGWAFTDEAVEADEKRTDWGAQCGHGIKASTNLNFHLHFVTGARVPEVNEYAYMELIYGVTNIDAVVSTATLAKAILIPASTPAYTHLRVGHADWNLSSTITASADLGGTIRRKTSNAADTYADTIYLLAIGAHAQFSRAGTAE